MLRTGVLSGVGVGPGDPELMTLKAVRVIESAGALAVPRSEAGSQSQALAIASKAASLDGKEIIELSFPMTKDRGALAASRRLAAGLICERLSAGVDVAFITLGDPLFYSTFSYLVPLVRELCPGAQVRSVPGVTSYSAAASLLGEPLAETDERVIIIPAAYDMERVREALASADTVVLMKVNRNLDSLIDMLEGSGLAAASCFVSRAGWPGQEIVRDITSLRGTRADYFSMIIVRKNG